MSELIKVVQLPVIEERLQSVKESVEARLAEAKSMACTPETLASVKETRTQLNREFEDLEAMRKSAKAAVMEPYNKFEATYKDCAANAYKSAIADLGNKIRETEDGIKAECRERLEGYFAELVSLEGLEWLTFDRAGILVDLTSAKQKTPRKLMQWLKDFVDGVARDVKAIDQMEDRDEIMVEYRDCLDLARAVSAVQTRHKRLQQEAEAAKVRQATQEAHRTAVERVEAVAPPVVMPPANELPRDKSESVYRCSFTVHATKGQLKKLKEFLNQEGIRYE